MGRAGDAKAEPDAISPEAPAGPGASSLTISAADAGFESMKQITTRGTVIKDAVKNRFMSILLKGKRLRL